MALNQQQLIAFITKQVLAVLHERGKLTESQTGVNAKIVTNQAIANQVVGSQVLRADIRPPQGICTAGQSKYQENIPQPHSPSTSSPSQNTPLALLPLTGIVTASRLQQVIDASSQGIALLSPDARLSPLANDFVRHHPGKVRRASVLHQAPTNSEIATHASPSWLWWIDGQCDAVKQMTNQRHALLRPIAENRSAAALVSVVRNVALALKNKTSQGALLFVHNAARAMCLANRCASIRAVVGTCGEAVEQGIVELGANVLVVEYPHHGPRAMAAMVDRMTQQIPVVPAHVQRELADLHRCG